MTTVGVIGLGYVGLPLAVAFAQEGCDVVALDVDPRKVEAIAAGESYIEDVPVEAAARRRRAHPADHALRAPGEGRRGARLRADAAHAQPRARPRPADRLHARARRACCRRDQLVVLESTTYPGTTRERWRRCSRSRGSPRAATSTWRSRPSAWTRAAPTSRCATRRRCVGGLTDACAERARGAVRAGLRRGRASSPAPRRPS